MDLRPIPSPQFMGTIATLTRATVDLVMGTLVGMISEGIFSKSWKYIFRDMPREDDEKSNMMVLAVKSARVFLQMLLSCLLALEVRSLYITPETEDPLGGIMFILALGHLMPKFWKRVRNIANSIYELVLYRIEKKRE